MPSRSLRILTQNVKMLPGLLGEGDADLVRAAQLAAAINAASPPYDIICLQEVFDEDVREVFIRAFASCALVPKVDDNDIFHQDSGLFFASRCAIRGWSFEEFDASEGADSWSDKGIFGARLDTAASLDGVNLCVFHTHMQASYEHPTEYCDVRTKQLGQMSHFVQRALSRVRPERSAAILVGDMNVVGETDEYRGMIQLLGNPQDLYREKHAAAEGFTYDGQLNVAMIDEASREVRQRLDYVLAFDSVTVPGRSGHLDLRSLTLEAADIIRLQHGEKDLSDHFGVDVVVST